MSFLCPPSHSPHLLLQGAMVLMVVSCRMMILRQIMSRRGVSRTFYFGVGLRGVGTPFLHNAPFLGRLAGFLSA